MEISGHTRPYAVLGHPIAHTLSPVMHNAAFSHLGMDAVYLAFDVLPERLMDVLPAMVSMGFGGINLTIPHKVVAFNGLSDLDISAQRLGAVNTVVIRDGSLRGFNTDGCGFLRSLEEAFHFSPTDRDVFILGCGGAGRAVAITCAAEGARHIRLADRTLTKANRVAEEIRTIAPSLALDVVTLNEAASQCRKADLAVQATSVGMKQGESSLMPDSAFREGQLACDLIYNFPETVWMRAAAAGGARTINGLGMLLHQGAEAFTLWTGVEAPVAIMRGALESALYCRPSRHTRKG